MGLAIKEHTDENVMDKTQLEFAMFPSTRAIIREVFVQKNILPEILVCIWQFKAFLFYF
jgi:hypothetical protein